MRFFALFAVFACATIWPAAAWAANLSEGQKQSVRFSEGFVWFSHLKTPQLLDGLALQDAKGQRKTLDDFKGRYILLNLWATWCPPCIEELPSFAKLRKRRAGKNFDVLVVSVDKRYSGERIARYLERKSIKGIDAYYDVGGDFQRILAPNGLPTTYLLDRQGRVRFKMSGPAKWHSKDGLAFIDNVIRQLEKENKEAP